MTKGQTYSLLFAFIILLSLFSGIMAYWFSFSNRRAIAVEELEQKLHLELDLRKNRLNHYFDATIIDLRLVAESVALQNPLREYYKFKSASTGESARGLRTTEVDFIRLGISLVDFGYYDFFIIDNDGNIIYTVKEESDLGTNLNNGPYANSELGIIYRRLVDDNKKAGFSAIREYGPSNSIPSLFIAVPVKEDTAQNLLGVIAIQVNAEQLQGAIGPKTSLVLSDFLIESDQTQISMTELIGSQNKVNSLNAETDIQLDDESNLRFIASVPIGDNVIISNKYPMALGMLVWFTTMFVGLMVRRFFHLRTQTGISISSVLIVQSTWNSIIDQPEKIGRDFYQNLLQRDKKFKRILSAYDNMELLQSKMVSIMSLIVNNADRMDIIKGEIVRLASFHVRLGIEPEDVPKFMECMYQTVEQQYDGDFSPKMKKAWDSILSEVVKIFNTELRKEKSRIDREAQNSV